jgi:hypothetical protein
MPAVFDYKDHIKDKPNVDNCNTALYETIALKEKNSRVVRKSARLSARFP